MEYKVGLSAPYFDPAQLREELTGLAKSHVRSELKLKQSVLERLKLLTAEARKQAQHGLEVDGNGRRCAEGLSLFQDELIRLIYEFTVHHVYRAKNPSAAERMAIVATGGYGRGLLAPGSDIDLLFVLPYKQTAWGESVVEYILYLLWDLGFKVGHATRTVSQCIRLSRADMTVRTAVLDARLIWGDRDLYDELQETYQKNVVRGSGREFVEEKLAEQDRRHERSGASRYLVEPNIKDGKGGLRDLHTLYWLGKYLSAAEDTTDFVAAGVFSADEYHSFRKCEDFLWTVRCHLHFHAGRAEERISFDVQQAMAERLGYASRSGLRAVERFMKHYFLVAKDVGDLTRIVCSALEMKQLKSAPRLNQLLDKIPWRNRAKAIEVEDFRIENGRITIADRNVFQNDPVNLVRLFYLAEKHDVKFHPDALRLVRASLRLIDRNFRRNPEANRIFLELLTESENPENALRKMNESGVLGRFIPAFGKVVSMMQFNMYHHFTVDEHLLRSIGVLAEIARGESAGEHPLATSIFPSVQHRRALFVAMLLHDIAKGRDEDHSLAGARIARLLCPRLGLSAAETDAVAWLVEYHLVMSQIAQSRDINDPKTIQDFAKAVQSPERLKLLLILTVADIRAVGPGVWNGWKGQLLRALYHETEPVLAGGHTQLSHKERIASAQDELRAKLSNWPPAEIEHFIERHFPAYWLRTDLDRQVAHARLIARAEKEEKLLVTDFATDSFTDITEFTIFSPSHPNLLCMIAGACAAADANIVDAQISTTRDGMALDTIFLQKQFERVDDERRRADRIARTIEKLLKGESRLDSLVSSERGPQGRARAFNLEPEVLIDNTLSDDLTVIEVSGLDRPGLLYALTQAMAELQMDITSAHIATFGEKVVDVFYVTDIIGGKITSEDRKSTIRSTLAAVLERPGVDAGKPQAATA